MRPKHIQKAIDETPEPKRKRGTVNNDNRLQAFTSGGKAGEASWGGCDSERLQGVVDGITALGGAVTFGLSRDKGAHSLTLMLGGNRAPLWFNGDADLDDELDGVLATLKAID